MGDAVGDAVGEAVDGAKLGGDVGGDTGSSVVSAGAIIGLFPTTDCVGMGTAQSCRRRCGVRVAVGVGVPAWP